MPDKANWTMREMAQRKRMYTLYSFALLNALLNALMPFYRLYIDES